MPGRLGGQLVDGGDPVADEPVFVVDTGPADEGNWSIVATDRSAADGSWSVSVPNTDPKRYHAVAQFEDGGTLKNALSKPFLTSQPFVQTGAVNIGFDVLPPSTIGRAIPDTVVDNFENKDDSPAGPYDGDSDALDSFYSGQTDGFARVKASPVDTFAVERTSNITSRQYVFSRPGDGLPRYPEDGEMLTCLIQERSTNTQPKLLFNVENGSNPGGYVAGIDTSNEDLQIFKQDDLTSTDDTQLVEESGIGINSNEWYWLEVSPPTTEDDSIDVALYNYEESDDERGSFIESASANDSDFPEANGVGFGTRSGSGVGTFIDRIQIID